MSREILTAISRGTYVGDPGGGNASSLIRRRSSQRTLFPAASSIQLVGADGQLSNQSGDAPTVITFDFPRASTL